MGRRVACAATACAGLLPIVLAGCASPGPPLPPSLKLPAVVTASGLTAERAGDVVTVRWTTPIRTTDKLLIRGLVEAEICRQTVTAPAVGATAARPLAQNSAQAASASTATASGTAKSAAAGPCSPVVARVQVEPGEESEAVDPLPGALTSGPAPLLAYRVQLRNAAGRTAGASPAVFAAAGAAPETLGGFRGRAAKAGVVLEWSPEGSEPGDTVELERTEVGAEVGAVAGAGAAANRAAPVKGAPPAASRPGGRVSNAPTSRGGLLDATKQPAEVRLSAGGDTGADPGGTIDRSAEIGHKYRYTAWRVRTVTVGGQTLELRSAPSEAVTVTPEDIFAPDAPAGLVGAPGLAGEGDGAKAAIDLSWEPNPEPRIAGYRVYRRELDGDGRPVGEWGRVSGAELVTAAAYHDTAVVAGRRYAYRVTAVSEAGLESPPGNEVTEGAPTANGR